MIISYNKTYDLGMAGYRIIYINNNNVGLICTTKMVIRTDTS